MERELLGLVSQKITLHGWGTLWGLSRVSEIFVPIRFSGLWFGYHRRLWTGPCYRCSDLDGVSWDQRVWQGHRNGMKWMTGNASNESTSISWIPFPKPLLLHPQILRFTLPQTNSSHLKHWSWFRWVSFWGPASWQVRTVLGSLIFRVHSSHRGFVWSWVRLSAETMRHRFRPVSSQLSGEIQRSRIRQLDLLQPVPVQWDHLPPLPGGSFWNALFKGLIDAALLATNKNMNAFIAT